MKVRFWLALAMVMSLLLLSTFADAQNAAISANPGGSQPPGDDPQPLDVPPNDCCEAATPINLPKFGTLHQIITQDTLGATRDNDAGNACTTPDLLAFFGFVPAATEVWYTFTPSSDGQVTIDATGSSYPVLMILLFTPCDPVGGCDYDSSFMGCPGQVDGTTFLGAGGVHDNYGFYGSLTVDVRADTTYFLLVAQGDESVQGGPGGDLVMDFTYTGPAPIPALSQRGMILFVFLLAGLAVWIMRRKIGTSKA
jgi:hypothetical protein